MAITVSELHNSVEISHDLLGEGRVRTWEVVSSNGEIITEGDLVESIRSGTINTLPIPGDTWPSYGYGSGQESMLGLAQGKEYQLTCHSVEATQIAISGTSAVFKYMAKYSTKPNFWIPRVSYEIKQNTQTVYYDLDAILWQQGYSRLAGAPCDNWSTITGIPEGTDPGTVTPPASIKSANWAHVASIRNGDGVDVSFPQLVMTVSIVGFNPKAAGMDYYVLSTNNKSHQNGYFEVQDEWLLEGFVGKLLAHARTSVADDIYDMEFKFSQDKNRHRPSLFVSDQSTGFPEIDETKKLPKCRDYRVYERKDWDPLVSFLQLT